MSALGDAARRFLRSQRNGVLSTLSQRLQGFPFGSVTPYVSDHAGCPVILISDIAEHSRNIAADPRVSLIVQPFSENMQEVARITVVGEAVRLDAKDALAPRYLAHFPEAEAYFAMHDFRFYRLEPVRIRYIGGFGKIHWLLPEAYLCESGRLADSEGGILDHMNRDHGDSLGAYCRHLLGIQADQVEMAGIDPDGIDLRADGRMQRIEFPHAVRDAASAREALIHLSRQCRN